MAKSVDDFLRKFEAQNEENEQEKEENNSNERKVWDAWITKNWVAMKLTKHVYKGKKVYYIVFPSTGKEGYYIKLDWVLTKLWVAEWNGDDMSFYIDYQIGLDWKRIG